MTGNPSAGIYRLRSVRWIGTNLPSTKRSGGYSDWLALPGDVFTQPRPVGDLAEVRLRAERAAARPDGRSIYDRSTFVADRREVGTKELHASGDSSDAEPAAGEILAEQVSSSRMTCFCCPLQRR